MVRRWVREENKRDIIVETTKKVLDWYDGNKQTAMAVAGITLVVVVVALLFIYNINQSNKNVEDRISQLHGLLYSGNYSQALMLCDDTLKSYSTTNAAKSVYVYKAIALYNSQQYKEAAVAYREFINRKGQKVVIPIAMLNEAVATEAQGDYVKAVELYDNVIKAYPDHYIAPSALWNLARCYMIANRGDEAVKTYERIITRYPNTYWKQKAEEKIVMLKTGNK
ncbi:MAG: tetratricopeptide repeat protein [Elusimicrobiota bacterium]